MKKMVNIRTKDQQKGSASPRTEVGEIDTRAPFQSVKAAVNMFGEVAVSRDKPAATVRSSRPISSENVLDLETQFLFAQTELNKYKHQIESAETTKARVQSELESAKVTLQDLATRLKTADKAKQLAIEVAEAIKKRAKELEVAKSQQHLGNAARKQELDEEREQYTIIAGKLDAAKQLLTKVRQDFDAALDGKSASFQQAAEAQRLTNTNKEKVAELSDKIKAMKESKQEFQLASVQALGQQAQIVAEKDARIQACKSAKEEADKTLESLKSSYDADMNRNLEEKLAETTAEIEVLQEEMKRLHASEMEAVKVVTNKLNEATKMLQQIADEESSLRDTVTSLRLELANVMKEQAELKEKEAQKQLQIAMDEVENDALEQQKSTLKQLLLETESSTREAEIAKRDAEDMKQEAENSRLLIKELEEKLQRALIEAEEAKGEERKALHEMNILSENRNGLNNDPSNNIKISVEEFDSLKRKVRECEEMVETKVTEAMAEAEAINIVRNEAEKKLEANLKAIEEIKEATEMALKSAEMAETAQNVVEGELRRWREKEEMT